MHLQFEINHDAAGLAELCRRLRGAGVTAVAIERPSGLIVDALLETFDVSEDVLRHDVERVVEVLARYGVLVPSVTEASR